VPVYNRRELRQRLGTAYLRDTYVSQTTGSWGATASWTIYDSRLADASLAGEEMYQRSIVRVLTGSAYIADARVATFNTGSGAFMCLLTGASTIVSGTNFEVHSLVPPSEKDLCIDEALKRMRVESVVAVWGTGEKTYSLGAEVLTVLQAHIAQYPVGSGAPDLPLNWWSFSSGQTTNAIQVEPAVPFSAMLVCHYERRPTLDAADTATVYLPSDDWLLSGAAAEANWLLERKAPATETEKYRSARRELAATFVRLGNRFKPSAARKLQLESWH